MSVPTRLPYGLSFVKPFNAFGATSGQFILSNNSSPDVSLGTYFVINVSNTFINFTGGERGKLLFLKCETGGAAILSNSVGGIRFNNIIGTTSAGSTVAFTTAGNITMLNGELLGFIHDSVSWCLIGDRFALSTQA